jgi:DNA processing protein
VETNKDFKKERILCALALREYKVQERRKYLEGLLIQYSEEAGNSFFNHLSSEIRYRVERTYSEALSSDLSIVSVFDEIYPAQLRNIYDPPPVLFGKGNLTLLKQENIVAIVGSRKGDGEGVRIAHEFGQELASAGCVVVSGLALGIDAAAHAGAVQSSREGSTIAVLGNGLPDIWPVSNRQLAQDIIAHGGLILSQFDLKEPPYPQNFLDRNRVISGLARVVLVVQATERSGSLVTARYALEQGRDVMAIPGNIKNPRYAGSNRILKEGAGIATNPEDILETLGLTAHKLPQSLQVTNHPYISIIRERGEISLDDLKNLLNNPEDFNKVLLELELAEQVVLKPGNMLSLL